jgi:hypothetical protein
MSGNRRRLLAAAVPTAIAAVVLAGSGAAGASMSAAGTRAAAVARVPSAGTWGTAEEVPGTAALNVTGYAAIDSVSCGAAGNCGAGGFYSDSSGHQQAFVVGETNGTWGTAEQVPGTAGGTAKIDSVSCAAAGNCSAGGSYTGATGPGHAFVVGETGGTWGTAQTVAGALTRSLFAGTLAVSCASAGNCGAGGDYGDASGHYQAFVVSETNGTWGAAEQVPGTAALNTGGEAEIGSVSCASAGNCSAGGFYRHSGHDVVFVVSETNGSWGTAQKVPGLAALSQGGSAFIRSLSCGAAGNCSAGGSYTESSGHQQAFIVSEKNGTWGTAKKVAGALNVGGYADIGSLSCGAAGTCTAGGHYTGATGHDPMFVVSETNGSWGTAKTVVGTWGAVTSLNSVSCTSAGNCSAGGVTGATVYQHAFVVSKTNGSWGTAELVPGLAALNQGKRAAIDSVSCASAGNCSAGGSYKDALFGGNIQAFVVSETNGTG